MEVLEGASESSVTKAYDYNHYNTTVKGKKSRETSNEVNQQRLQLGLDRMVKRVRTGIGYRHFGENVYTSGIFGDIGLFYWQFWGKNMTKLAHHMWTLDG